MAKLFFLKTKLDNLFGKIKKLIAFKKKEGQVEVIRP